MTDEHAQAQQEAQRAQAQAQQEARQEAGAARGTANERSPAPMITCAHIHLHPIQIFY
jgi:F0F1-type ATP synthase membrane subunit b/b'